MVERQQDMIRLDCPRWGAPPNIGAQILTCEYCGTRLILKQAVPTRQNTPACPALAKRGQRC